MHADFLMTIFYGDLGAILGLGEAEIPTLDMLLDAASEPSTKEKGGAIMQAVTSQKSANRKRGRR